MHRSEQVTITEKYEKRLQTMLAHITNPQNKIALYCTPTSSNIAPPKAETNNFNVELIEEVSGVPVTPNNIANFSIDFQNLSTKDASSVKNIAWLVCVLKSLEQYFKNVDYEKKWDEVLKLIQLVFEIIKFLRLLPGFGEAAVYKIAIDGLMNDPTKRRIVVFMLQKIVLGLQAALSITLKMIENNELNISLPIFNDKIANVMLQMNPLFERPEIANAIAAVGGAAAFLAGAYALLPLLGFGINGIIGGSIAAKFMGAAVAEGSLFSLLQSAGVVGFSTAATGAILVGGGVVGAATYVYIMRLKALEHQRNALKGNVHVIRSSGTTTLQAIP